MTADDEVDAVRVPDFVGAVHGPELVCELDVLMSA